MLPDSDNGSTSVFPDSTAVEAADGSRRADDKNSSLVTTLVVTNSVLLVCTIAGAGFILLQLVRKLRKRSEFPEQYDTHFPLTGIDSSDRVDSSPNSKPDDVTGHVYETVN
jgi:hypothetical protein